MLQMFMLVTALSTTGQCPGGQCSAPAPAMAAAPGYSYQSYYRAPAYAPQAAYAPRPAMAQGYRAAPQMSRPAAPYNMASFYYAPSSCPGGNCYRR